jgi:uncharacterized protein YwbE
LNLTAKHIMQHAKDGNESWVAGVTGRAGARGLAPGPKSSIQGNAAAVWCLTPSLAGSEMRAMSQAVKILDRKLKRGDLMVQIVIWQLLRSTPDRPHGLKYRLWCGRAGETVVRNDNETGKGDHRHGAAGEEPYVLVSPERLVADFAADVERLSGWRFE